MKATPASVLALMLLSMTPCAAQLAPRQEPAKTIPVPDTVSPQMQIIIAQPYGQIWKLVPRSAAEWKAIVEKAAAPVIAGLPALRDQLGAAGHDRWRQDLYRYTERNPAEQS